VDDIQRQVDARRGAVRREKRAEAEPLLVRGYEGMKQRAAKIPIVGKPRLAEAQERLVELYDAWDKPDQATRWRRGLESEKSHAEMPSGPVAVAQP
jgi:hypothetical protein